MIWRVHFFLSKLLLKFFFTFYYHTSFALSFITIFSLHDFAFLTIDVIIKLTVYENVIDTLSAVLSDVEVVFKDVKTLSRAAKNTDHIVPFLVIGCVKPL